MNFNKGQGLQITVARLLPVTKKPLLETKLTSIVCSLPSEKGLELLNQATRGHSDDQKILLLQGHYLRIAFVTPWTFLDTAFHSEKFPSLKLLK